MSMKICRKCNVNLNVGENVTPSMFRNKDYICKPCANHHRRTNKWRMGIKGVYGIFSDNECLYVGESGQVRRRISDHKYSINNPDVSCDPMLYNALKHYSNVEFRIIEECDNHKERELHYIKKLQPVLNSNLVA